MKHNETTQTGTTLISPDALHANDYNPNRMTEAEFAELVAEIRHLGHLPKPIVARAADNGGFVIVDGEHNWRAAQEAGLSQVPCEIIEADDFEAMRQTYKRNQHGTHNKVLLAKMFKRMGRERGLSLRELAKEIEVSEGTIRNTIEYLKAVKVRNSYAPDKDTEAEIATLSLRQVRLFNRLPQSLGNMWLDSGADVKTLLGGYDDLHYSSEEDYLDGLSEYYEKSGLLQYIKRVRSPQQFTKALEQVKQWARWEQRFFWHILGGKWYSREEFRQYADYYYKGVWPLAATKGTLWIDAALNVIIKHDGKEACFRITPEEFGATLERVADYCEEEKKGLGLLVFQDYLKKAVYEKTGERVDAGLVPNIETRSMEIEIEREAPDYIQESKLEILISKYALWKVVEELKNAEDVSEQDKADIEQVARELAKQEFIPPDRHCLMGKADRKERLKWGENVKLREEKSTAWSAIAKLLALRKAVEHRNTAGNVELAMEVTDCIYDRSQFPDAHQKMSLILSQLQEAELQRLHEEIVYQRSVAKIRAALDEIHGGIVG